MKLTYLDIQTLQDVRLHWVNCAITHSDVSEASLELSEQFFDYIEQNQLYGDYHHRSNINTYVGVDLNDDGKIDVIVEVIFYRRGRVKTFKIMDIHNSPSIEALEDSAYDMKCIDTLVFVINQFVNESSDVVGSATKIYARSNTSLRHLTEFHAATESLKEEFDAAGLEVSREGERWLSFRVKK